MVYPNLEYWAALRHGERAIVGDKMAPVFVVDAGEIVIPSGRLMCFDPYTYEHDWEKLAIVVPSGRYSVKITYVDVRV